MRDDRNRWPSALGPDRPRLTGQAVTARLVSLERQTVLSGSYETLMSVAGLDVPAVGTFDTAKGDHYAIRQRRDRILVVGGPEIAEGWHDDAGVAATDLTAAYAVIDVSGRNAARLFATGTEISPDVPTPSAARLWHGYTCLVYRYGAEDTYRFHVRSAHLEAVWEMMERQIGLISRLPDLNDA